MSTGSARNVVLVHGGFVDGSGWQGVYDALTADGFRVTVVQNPTQSLEGDVEAARQVLDELDGDVVLVGHSYGGVVITEAGTHPSVSALVYVAAFAPDKGESVNTLIANPPPGAPVPPILPPRNGYCSLTASASTRRSPATCRPRRQRSWPTRRFRGASAPSKAPSQSRRGGSSPAGTWSPVTTG